MSKYRNQLEKKVLERIENGLPSTPDTTPAILLPDTTVIVADVHPFGSVVEAEKAEADIDWFAPGHADRRRACRLAFAALELQRYLRHMTRSPNGFTFAAAPVAGATHFFLKADETADRVDGAFEIFRQGKDFCFQGLSLQGNLYAVYEYLEQLGCRFLRPGGDGEVIPVLKTLPAPQPTHQTPGFRIRRLHGWRKNRATPDLVDWMGKGRINVFGADNLVPGMRKRGILLSSGMHDVLAVTGLDNHFCIHNPTHRDKLLGGIVEAFSRGPWQDADLCDYIGGDWGKRCACAACLALGNPANVELYIFNAIRQAFHRAFREGKINRDLPVFGYAYFDSEDPPKKALTADFDTANVAMEFWSMRCWEHTLDDPHCCEDFPIISTMNDFLGQRMDLPSNRRIDERIQGWLDPACPFKGEFGVGYYLSNAGNYFQPLVLSAVLAHELPRLHTLGARRVGYMHISPGDWGPKAVTNLLYGKLAWNPGADSTAILADYFCAAYGPAAADMAKATFALERGMANFFNLKRFVLKRLNGEKLSAIQRHSHVCFHDEEAKPVCSLNQMSRNVNEALKTASTLGTQNSNRLIHEDLRWVQYAAWTVDLYIAYLLALDARETGSPRLAGEYLKETDTLLANLRTLPMLLSLPENVRVDAAEASGLLPLIERLARELGVSLASTSLTLRVRTSIEPEPAHLADAGQLNPVRWFADPAWPVVSDTDLIGLTLQPLLATGTKHLGLVAQRIGGQMMLVTVGEDLSSPTTKAGTWDVFSGYRISCFTGKGKVLWAKPLYQEGLRVATGPWPAFVDRSSQGDWAISAFRIEDGGSANRGGFVSLYEVQTGDVIWERQIPDHAYPGGNGSCVVADFDGDGRREIVYGLCHCVLCVDAQTGAIKWVYDDRIQICHGRLAMADTNDDGRPEIIVATEYANHPEDPNDDRSSILILDGLGRVLRRMDNIRGDLGSTQIVVTDVDRDGKPEIIHGSENLCFHEPRHSAELFVKERWLVPKFDPVPVGGVRFAVGDVDGDGYPEAVAISNYRDGGPHVKPEIVCVRLLDGRIKWRRPVSRVWLDGDAIMADVDGDGQLEIIVSCQYSSGYMQEAGTSPWGDLYILKGDGRIVYKRTFPDAIFSPIAVDIDGDGKLEIVIGCYDGTVYTLKTPGPAAPCNWPVVCQNFSRTGVYQ